MKRALIFMCIGLGFFAFARKHVHDVHDQTNMVDKERMLDLAQWIMKEAFLKIRQVNDIRDDHSNKRAFDVGLILGNVRERYRRMLEIYREYRDKHSNRSRYFSSAYRKKFTGIYFVIAMENVHELEVDIDKLIHTIESVESDDLNPDPRYGPLTTTLRTLRADDKKQIARMAAEQELKSRAREAHLMRRLGVSGTGHTTGKRFQRQWPVDENWDFGAYGDMNIYS